MKKLIYSIALIFLFSCAGQDKMMDSWIGCFKGNAHCRLG